MSRASPVSTSSIQSVSPKVVSANGGKKDTQPLSSDQATYYQSSTNFKDTALIEMTLTETTPPRLVTLQISEFSIDSVQTLYTTNQTPITHTEPQLRDRPVQNNEIAALNVANSLLVLKKAARSGDVNAQFELGSRYYGGSYVQKNYKKAFEMFYMAAKQE